MIVIVDMVNEEGNNLKKFDGVRILLWALI